MGRELANAGVNSRSRPGFQLGLGDFAPVFGELQERDAADIPLETEARDLATKIFEQSFREFSVAGLEGLPKLLAVPLHQGVIDARVGVTIEALRDLFEGRLVVVDHIMHTKAGILRALPQMEGYSILFTNFRTSRI